MMNYSIIFNIFFILTNFTGYIFTAKILGIFPFGLKSHYIIFDSLMVELARRGHNVTVVNSFPKNKEIPNYKDIDVSSCYEVPKSAFTVEHAYSYQAIYPLLMEMFSFVPVYDGILDCGPMKDLRNTGEKYDLLITEIFQSDSTLGYVYKFQAPFISFCGNTIYPWASYRVGVPDNPAYINFNHNEMPLELNNPTFYQRLYNTYGYVLAKYFYNTMSEIPTQKIVRKHFGDSVPDIREIAKNTSLILSYSHFTLNSPKPLTPQVVEVGGIQIKDPHQLPKDIEEFIKESKDGVIYFCLGSLLQAHTLPDEKRDAFLYAFSRIPQRVIWKWEADSMPGKPDNVLLSKWLPQRDILAHPNVKLFIAHGGALGISEAVYEGVPVLGIPIFADQTINIKSLQSAGAGKLLAYKDVSNKTVLENIELLLNNYKEYKKNAMELSSRYKDRPMSPLDTAVYWTEYVIRHKGAYHLKSAAADMPWYQYFLIDVISTILIFIFVTSSILYYTIKKLISFVLRAFIKPHKKNSKKLN